MTLLTTTCKSGLHPWTPENIKTHPYDNKRWCGACDSDRRARLRAKVARLKRIKNSQIAARTRRQRKNRPHPTMASMLGNLPNW